MILQSSRSWNNPSLYPQPFLPHLYSSPRPCPAGLLSLTTGTIPTCTLRGSLSCEWWNGQRGSVQNHCEVQAAALRISWQVFKWLGNKGSQHKGWEMFWKRLIIQSRVFHIPAWTCKVFPQSLCNHLLLLPNTHEPTHSSKEITDLIWETINPVLPIMPLN